MKTKLNQCTHMPKNIPKGNIIHINNKNITIEKTTCKDFYWHIINTDTHIPTSIHKWSDHYTNFHNAENNVWSKIFKFPFKTVRDTKIQTFQYNIVHRVIPRNHWLCSIKVKEIKACDYCGKTDDIVHFFKNYPKVNEFWSYWINWWEYLSGIAIKMAQY